MDGRGENRFAKLGKMDFFFVERQRWTLSNYLVKYLRLILW